MLLCLGTLQAQQLEGNDDLRMAPRANVITYDDEDAIEHLRYNESSYYMSVMADWQQQTSDGVVSYSQLYDFPKDWREYRVFFRFMATPGYGLYVGDKLLGVCHDSRTVTEFDITDMVRFGKSSALSLRYVGKDDGSLLEKDGKIGLTGDCAILLKPLINVQDYTITTTYDAASGIGGYLIETDLYNARKKGKAYLEVEIWDSKGHQVDKLGKWCFFDKRNEVAQSISSSLADVLPWNAENPRLYTAVIRLYDESMALQDIVGTRFGFRTLSEQNSLVLNGKPITIRGITLSSDIDLSTPEAVKHLRSQMLQMKNNNINAIRTFGHGPASPRFYELCDELGFYVVCDANLFPASSMGQAVAADNDFSDLFSSRMRDMYGELKNHTSIIAWSLGTSPDNGICMQTAYKTLRQLDGKRPVVYSGAQYSDNTDMIVPQNCNVDFLNQYLSKNQSRNLLMLTYGSVVGNNFGGMDALWQKVIDHASVQGGFANIGHWQNLSEKPYLSELKHLYRPFDIAITSISADAAEFLITNLNDFRALSDYRLEYVICSNLKPNIVAGDVSMALKPGDSAPLKLKVPKLMLYAGEELYIKFTLRQRSNTISVPKNTVLYTAQFQLPSENMPQQPFSDLDGQPLQIEKDTLHGIRIYNNNVSIVFDDSLGMVTQVDYRGRRLVTDPVGLSFSRTPSPNDLADPNGTRQWNRYMDMKREVVATNCRKLDNNNIGIDVMLRYSSDRHGDLFDVRQTYMVLPSGDVLINNDVTISEQIKSIAKIGLQMGLAPSLTTAEWLGFDRESYFDRCSAGSVSQLSRPISELGYRYEQPQHAGNHAQTRWAAFRNEEVGLYVDIIDTLCNFAIEPMSGDGRESEGGQNLRGWHLDVDYLATGVGGAVADMNLPESALLKKHKYQFTLHLRPYECMEYDAQDFRRITYPQVRSSIIDMPVITKSKERFDGPMLITLSCNTPKAEIRYTLDGTMPTEKSPLYTKPFSIQNSVVVSARAFKKDESPSFVATQQFTFDYVVSCTYAHKPNTPYNKNAAKALYDGELGDVNDLSRGWLGFSGHDVQVDFELGKSINMSGVNLRFAHVPDAWVFAPIEVSVSVSSDGKVFTDPVPAVITYDPASEQMNTTQLQILNIPVAHDNVRFVRVVAKPMSRIPLWHRAKGLNPWTMMDEIEIQEVIIK